MFFTLILFFIVIGVLVLVHELGHFWVARRAGMKVEEFGFGFPPRLFSFDRGGVKYSFNAIPFGGFVKILGEDGEDRNIEGSFSSKSAFKRFAVLIAGVVMNLIFAAFLLMISNSIGIRTSIDSATSQDGVSNIRVQILEVAEGSPADKAGLSQLDQITSVKVKGEEVIISSATDFQNVVSQNSGFDMILNVIRNGKSLEVPIVAEADSSGQRRIGVSLVTSGTIAYPWYEAIWRGIVDTYHMTVATLNGYLSIFTALFSDSKMQGEVAGPIGIATLTGKAARLGWDFLIQFVAIISVNLAILNSIPFPALDGGRILFLLIEKIKGSPISRKVEVGFNAGGFSLLIVLMIYVTIKDIIKLF